MLKQNSQLLRRLHQFIDIIIMSISFMGAYFIRRYFLPVNPPDISEEPNYYIILLLCIIFFYISFNFFDFYYPYRRQTFRQIFFKTIKGVLVGLTVVIFILYLFKWSLFSRLMMIIFLLLNIFFLNVSKYTIYRILSYYRRQGYNFKNVLLIGSKDRARDMIHNIRQNTEYGYRIFGCLETDQSLVGSKVTAGVYVKGTLADFHSLLINETIDEVVFAMPLKQIQEIRKYISFAEEIGVGIRILPDWQIQKVMYQPETASVYFENFIDIPTICISSTPRRSAEVLIKSGIDYLGAVLGLLFLSPLLLVIAVLIKATSKGPVLFKQSRIGLNGRRFTLYKFRTMIVEAEDMKVELLTENEMDGPVFKLTSDPRITKVGNFLRKMSLDELPQLINVLRGEMSLVGPRPPLPYEVERYKPWQRRRLSMKPGLTCIWQVSGRNEIKFESWMKMDLEYIDKWTLLLDFKLLIFTFWTMVKGSGK